MGDVTNFLERSKEFEEAHYSCRELLEEQLNKIEQYSTRWLVIAIGALFLFMFFGFIYFNFKLTEIRKRVDYRYFLLKENLESINHVKLDKGKIIEKY